MSKSNKLIIFILFLSVLMNVFLVYSFINLNSYILKTKAEDNKLETIISPIYDKLSLLDNSRQLSNISSDIKSISDKAGEFRTFDIQARKIRWCGDNAYLSQRLGMSMFPYDWGGVESFAWVEPVKFSDIELGDVITYSTDNSNIVHAVCNKYSDRLYSCGYNNNHIDSEPVYPDQIIARDCIPPSDWK